MNKAKQRFLATVSLIPDAADGGIIAEAMRALANSAQTATGATLISPDGTVRYISRAEAERYVSSPKPGELRQ